MNNGGNTTNTIECQGDGCGREAYQCDDDDWYSCDRCGWSGSKNNPVVILQEQLDDCISQLRDCHDLLNDCGYFYENDVWVDGDNRDDEEINTESEQE